MATVKEVCTKLSEVPMNAAVLASELTITKQDARRWIMLLCHYGGARMVDGSCELLPRVASRFHQEAKA